MSDTPVPAPQRRLTKVEAKGYVWCDSHCCIHERRKDVYDDDSKGCRPGNWRRVFVETRDPTEEF